MVQLVQQQHLSMLWCVAYPLGCLCIAFEHLIYLICHFTNIHESEEEHMVVQSILAVPTWNCCMCLSTVLQ